MSRRKTNGGRSSETRACYHAFYGGMILAIYGIFEGVDLTALGILVGSVTLPLMWYAGARSAIKWKHGEEEGKNVA
jgi:hypothetical protein